MSLLARGLGAAVLSLAVSLPVAAALSPAHAAPAVPGVRATDTCTKYAQMADADAKKAKAAQARADADQKKAAAANSEAAAAKKKHETAKAKKYRQQADEYSAAAHRADLSASNYRSAAEDYDERYEACEKAR